MKSTYVQKSSTVQKTSSSKAATVLDSSAQGISLQRKADMANNAMQRDDAPRPNNTGIPDNLKSGIESLSGFSMDNVRVHFNSSKPATVQALAYTQGTDIHVAPGQEKCLPHEAWHVAQQMAGRVSPTTNINGMPVNDNVALEHEADVMGEKAVQCKSKTADAKKSVPLEGKNIQREGKYKDEKKRVVDGFYENWDRIYNDIKKNKASLIDERKIGSIGPISLILTRKHTTAFSSNGMIVWIDENDVNGNSDQLLQRCLHELGHYVDGNDCYSQEYHKNAQKNNRYSNPLIVAMGRELYADMFAFVVRLREKCPKSEDDLNQMIDSIDLNGRPQNWNDVRKYNDAYPPVLYEKKLFREYGKKMLLKQYGEKLLLKQKKQKFDIVEYFDKDFENLLKRLANTMKQNGAKIRKGMALKYLEKWYNGNLDISIESLQRLIEDTKLTKRDIHPKYKHIWNNWILR